MNFSICCIPIISALEIWQKHAVVRHDGEHSFLGITVRHVVNDVSIESEAADTDYDPNGLNHATVVGVKNINNNWNVQSLVEYFGQIGDINECRVVRGRWLAGREFFLQQNFQQNTRLF